MARNDTITGFAKAIADYVLDAIEDAATDARDEIELNNELDGEDAEGLASQAPMTDKRELESLSTSILRAVHAMLRGRMEEADDIAISSSDPELHAWEALRQRYPRQRYLL